MVYPTILNRRVHHPDLTRYPTLGHLDTFLLRRILRGTMTDSQRTRPHCLTLDRPSQTAYRYYYRPW